MYSVVVPPDYTAGVRKIANLKGSFTSTLCDFLVAIVYLPEGFKANEQTLVVPPTGEGTKNIYMPSQNVLWFGLVNGYNQVHNWKVPISKNLNGGDQIIILMKPCQKGTDIKPKMYCACQYAICYR